MFHDNPGHPKSKESFLRSLTETTVWCLQAGNIADPKTSLRTFEPRTPPLTSPDSQVFCVSLDRSRRLRSNGQRDLASVTDLRGGRLLAYFPDYNLADGCAEDVSNGYFDVDNIPPYDTWVGMVENVESVTRDDGSSEQVSANFLVAWVPPAFLEIANGGVQVNPEECIAWLDELDSPFTRALRRLGLIE
jgi:hypothetical protein